MKRTKLVVLILCLIMATNIQSLAQSKLALELRVGGGNTIFDYQGNFSDLAVSSVNNHFFGLLFTKKLSNRFSYGFELDFYRFDINMRYVPLSPEKGSSGTMANYWGFGPKIQKDFHLVSPKFGVSIASGLYLNYTGLEEFEFKGDEFTIIRKANGEPRNPVRPFGTREVTSFFLVFRPEVGLFYDISTKSRLTFTAQYGINFNQPAIEINLTRIELGDEVFQNKYTYNGNYFSALLGYRYSF